MVSVCVWLTPFAVAVISTVVFAVTAVVLIDTAADIWPAAIVSPVTSGAANALLLVERSKLIGPGPAAASSVTVATVVLPPVTGLGASESEATPIGRTV